MIPYHSDAVEANFQEWGRADDIGYETVEGEPSMVSGRVDYGDMMGAIAAGAFKATTGKFKAVYAYAEHVCVHHGEVHLTDGGGTVHKMKKGDAWFIAKGETVIWDVKSDYIIKSFIVTPAEA